MVVEMGDYAGYADLAGEVAVWSGSAIAGEMREN